MSLGYACKTFGIPFTNERTCIQKFASKEKLLKIIEWNINSLNNIIEYNYLNNIKLFRISSGFIPFGSSSVNKIEWWNEFESLFKMIAEKIKEYDIRISTHPGQYTILNSPNKTVVERAIEDLWYHNKLLDCLGGNQSNKIILHVGGVYGDKELSKKRFIETFENLEEKYKKRIIIENDDKLFNINDCLELGKKLNIPVVFDILHNEINPSQQGKEINFWINECNGLWKDNDGKQKIHYAEQAKNKRTGSHSNNIKINNFMNFYNNLGNKNIDIMLEVKDKNISANKCNNCLFYNNDTIKIKIEWERYKYSIWERSNDDYKRLENLIEKNGIFCCLDFYNEIEKILEYNISKRYSLIVAHNIWQKIRTTATEEEKIFMRYFDNYKKGKCSINPIKNLFWKIAIKYKLFYLLSSYYFVL